MANYGYRADGSELRSQWETILYYLQSTGRTITSWDAIKEFGFTRLSAIVKQIEKNTGIMLKRQDICVETRYGGHTWVTEYWLEEDGE